MLLLSCSSCSCRGACASNGVKHPITTLLLFTQRSARQSLSVLCNSILLHSLVVPTVIETGSIVALCTALQCLLYWWLMMDRTNELSHGSDLFRLIYRTALLFFRLMADIVHSTLAMPCTLYRTTFSEQRLQFVINSAWCLMHYCYRCIRVFTIHT